MFIFKILLCLSMSSLVFASCSIEEEKGNYFSCLSKWDVVSKQGQVGNAGFLKDPSLMDDICVLPQGVRVEEMDRCVTNMVSPFCDSLTTHWSGMKAFATFICEHRETFIASQCRRNVKFQNAYEQCMTKTSQNECRKYRERNVCLMHALVKHCLNEDREFFKLAFSRRDSPNVAYACKHEPTPRTAYYVVEKQEKLELEVYDPINAASSRTQTTWLFGIVFALLMNVFH